MPVNSCRGDHVRMRIFRDRREAGKALALALELEPERKPVVLGLARGGVPLAFEVATRLQAPLDVLVVRKLGVPWQPELAMGAIASGGVLVRNEHVLRNVPDAERTLESVRRHEARELTAREQRYRGNRAAIPVQGRAVIVVDDGLATGASMQAAVEALIQAGAASVTVAVPVGPADTCARLARCADAVVCLEQPRDFMAVGQWYEDFEQTSDEEVADLLAAAPPPEANPQRDGPLPGSTPGSNG
jgi:putative phosphoribosyl transferase